MCFTIVRNIYQQMFKEYQQNILANKSIKTHHLWKITEEEPAEKSVARQKQHDLVIRENESRNE